MSTFKGTLKTKSGDILFPQTSADKVLNLHDCFVCTYGTTTFAEIEAAYAAGKIPVVYYLAQLYILSEYNSQGIIFANDAPGGTGHSYIFVSTEDIWQQSSKLYVDIDSNQTATGLKTFTQRPRSSATYTTIEYLQSAYNGTTVTAYPYIQTGVRRSIDWTNKLTTVLDGWFTVSQTKGFCGYDSGGQLGQSSGKWSTESGISNVNCVGAANRATVTQVMDTAAGKDTLYINGSQITQRSIGSGGSYASQVGYPLFVAATTSVGYSPAALTLYSFKMYNDNDELIRDFIPVRTPGGEVGLLDTVYNKFYANDGVGTFNVGADVGTFVSTSPFIIESDLGAVAFSNNYNDLSNKPSIPSAPGRLNTTNDTAQTTSASESLAGTVNLHKVAKTGTYSDLIGIPTIPTVGELDTSNTTPNTPDTESLSGHIDLHVISKTGSYLDLLNKPTIPSAPGTLNTTVATTIATNASESLSGDI